MILRSFSLILLVLLCLAPLAAAKGDTDAAEKLTRSADHEDRLKGIDQLVEIAGDRAERLILKLLEDVDWAVQVRACEAIGKIGSSSGRKALIRHCVEGQVRMVRRAAAKALQNLEPERTAKRLLDMARKEKKEEGKVRAIEAAYELISSDHFKKVRTLTRQKDVRASAAAITALGYLVVDESLREAVLKVIEKQLKNRDDKKHFFGYVAALHVLGRVDSDETRNLLIDELLEQPDFDPYVPERIARIFRQWEADVVVRAVKGGFERAEGKEEPLIRLLTLVSRLELGGLEDQILPLLADDVEERVRSMAVKALRTSDKPEVLTKVKGLLASESHFVVREAVSLLAKRLPSEDFRKEAAAIAGMESEELRLQCVVELAQVQGSLDVAEIEATIKTLVPFTKDEAWRVSTAAIVTIGTLGLGKDLPLVRDFKDERNWRLRAAAYEAFGRLRAIESVPFLIAGLDDDDPVVRGVCHTNLKLLLRQGFPAKRKIWEERWERFQKGTKIVKLSRRSEEEIKRDKELEERNRRYARPFEKDDGIKILQEARIIVVAGAWDKVEVVLDHLDIEHTLLRAQELKDCGLNPNQIVLINCEGNIDKETRKHLRWFTNVGGYVMTTDWALTKAVRVSFPGYIRQASRSSTGNDVVVVEEALPGHRLTRGVFDDVPALKWWLEIQAFPIEISYPERTEVVVDSAEMRQRYGTSPMSATFQWGLGKVLHAVSHFYLQEEGMAHVNNATARMVFARDNLGMSLEQIRKLRTKGAFEGSLTEDTMREIAPDYSMFRMIVNMVAEKAQWVENL